MALIINSNGTKINVENTNIVLSSVYCRLAFRCPADGKTIMVTFLYFMDKASFQDNKLIRTNLPKNITIALDDAAGEKQDIDTAHSKAKTHFEQLGHAVTKTDL